MQLSEAASWIIDPSGMDPYEDERYKRAALYTDAEWAYILHFGICYGLESTICCRYKLRTGKVALFWNRYSHRPDIMATDPYLPHDHWVPFTIDGTRKQLRNSKHVLALSLDIPLLKEING
jgi:hypothetical protein